MHLRGNMDCIVCKNPVADDLLSKCGGCGETFHYTCGGMSPNDYNSKYLKGYVWYCERCVNITHQRGVKANEPVFNASDMSLSDSESPKGANLSNMSVPSTINKKQSENHSSLQGTSGNESITFDRFQALLQTSLDQKFNQIKDYLNKVVDTKIAIAVKKLEDDFTNTTNFLGEEQNDIKMDLKSAENRIKTLEKEKSALESTTNDLSRRLETLEKLSRSHNVEIQAVPEKKSENLVDLVKKLYKTLGIPSAENEICSVRRVAKLKPESERPRNILLTLQTERQRDNLISAFRRYNKQNPSSPLSSSSIDIPGPSQRIYVAEHLAAACKELHHTVRNFAKENSYTYVWIKYGRVYLRKDDSGPAIHIKSKSDLNKLR